MKKVTAKRIDIAFYMKLYPLKGHKDAYWKSKTIVCTRSLKYLEDNFENQPIPKEDCKTPEVDNNIKFAQANGITGTPTLILPDGSVYSGTTDAERLIKMIDEAADEAPAPPSKGSSKKK